MKKAHQQQQKKKPTTIFKVRMYFFFLDFNIPWEDEKKQQHDYNTIYEGKSINHCNMKKVFPIICFYVLFHFIRLLFSSQLTKTTKISMENVSYTTNHYGTIF